MIPSHPPYYYDHGWGIGGTQNLEHTYNYIYIHTYSTTGVNRDIYVYNGNHRDIFSNIVGI